MKLKHFIYILFTIISICYAGVSFASINDNLLIKSNSQYFKIPSNLLSSVENKLGSISNLDNILVSFYNDIKIYNTKVVENFLLLPNFIGNLAIKQEYLFVFINSIISIVIILTVIFISFVIEKNIILFISRYSFRSKQKRIIDKLIFLGITLLVSFLPVLIASFLVFILSIVCFSFVYLFFTSSTQFLLLIIKFLIIWIFFRTILIFIKKILLVSYILKFWKFLDITYKDIKEFYIWIRRFLALLLIFVISIIFSVSQKIAIPVVFEILFIIFSLMFLLFLFDIKEKIKKSLYFLSKNTKYFYLRGFLNFIAKRFYIVIAIYVIFSLKSFFLKDYIGFFYFLSAAIISIILVVLYNSFQLLGRMYIARIFSYSFEVSIKNIYDMNNERSLIYENILGGKKFSNLIERFYYYILLISFLLFITEIWGIKSFAILQYILGVHFLLGIFQIGLIVFFISLFTILLVFLFRYKVINLEMQNNYDGVNKWLSVISLLKKAYMLICIIILLLSILIIYVGFNLVVLSIICTVATIVLFLTKDIIRNFLGALICILEDTFSINDYITIKEHSGIVESISALYVKLRDNEGKLHIIPFASIGSIINQTKIYSYSYVLISVDYDAEVEKAISIINQVSESLIQDVNLGNFLKEPVKVSVIYHNKIRTIDITCKIKTSPSKQWIIKENFLKRVKDKFYSQNIKTITDLY